MKITIPLDVEPVLIYPKRLSENQRQLADRYLNTVPTAVRQSTLDELEGRFRSGQKGMSRCTMKCASCTSCVAPRTRVASGTYFPPAVKRVEIPKADGGVRPLGVPTVSDRIAQTVVKMAFEPEVEPYFHEDSYGYRPINLKNHFSHGNTRKTLKHRAFLGRLFTTSRVLAVLA